MRAATARLLIRDVVHDDWRPVHVFLSDPEVTEHTSFHKGSEHETRMFIDECIFHNQQVPRFAHNSAIVVPATNDVTGWIGVGYPYEKGIADRSFGYALRRDHWNHGYMTEALTAMLHFCFVDLGVGSVFAEHRLQNPASGRVMEKAGMREVGIFASRSEPGVVERRMTAVRDAWLVEHAAPAISALSTSTVNQARRPT